MSNMLDDGAAFLAEQMKANASETVAYRRDDDSVSFDAQVGSSVIEEPDDDGVVVRIEVTDFIFDAADLELSDGATLPEIGDRIDRTIGSNTAVYEIVAPAGQSHWRYSDDFHRVIRVHAKFVRTESA